MKHLFRVEESIFHVIDSRQTAPEPEEYAVQDTRL